MSKGNDRENVSDVHLVIHVFISQIFAECLLIEHWWVSALLGPVNTGILLADTLTALMELLN